MYEDPVYKGTMTWWLFFFGFCLANGLAILFHPIFWLVLILPILDRIFIRYVVTEQSVIARRGIIIRETETITVKNIEGIDMKQSILGMILNYGTITIRGSGGDSVVFYHTPRPVWLKQVIQRQIPA